MPLEPITTNMAPKPSGPYSQAIRAGDILFLAGQGPFAPDGNFVGPSIAKQTRQVLRNLEAVARAAGSSLDNAVKTAVFLSSMDHFAEMNSVYDEFFSDPLPARTTVQSSLIRFDVEIDAVVWLGH
jgi:2-iminobutanoate/2-iminopropanoate deaminase